MPDPSLILGPACFLYATRIDAYATVHRTVAFNCSNPSPKTKSPTPNGDGLFVACVV